MNTKKSRKKRSITYSERNIAEKNQKSTKQTKSNKSSKKRGKNEDIFVTVANLSKSDPIKVSTQAGVEIITPPPTVPPPPIQPVQPVRTDNRVISMTTHSKTDDLMKQQPITTTPVNNNSSRIPVSVNRSRLFRRNRAKTVAETNFQSNEINSKNVVVELKKALGPSHSVISTAKNRRNGPNSLDQGTSNGEKKNIEEKFNEKNDRVAKNNEKRTQKQTKLQQNDPATVEKVCESPELAMKTPLANSTRIEIGKMDKNSDNKSTENGVTNNKVPKARGKQKQNRDAIINETPRRSPRNRKTVGIFSDLPNVPLAHSTQIENFELKEVSIDVYPVKRVPVPDLNTQKGQKKGGERKKRITLGKSSEVDGQFGTKLTEVQAQKKRRGRPRKTQLTVDENQVHRIKETNKQREASSNGKSNGSTKAGTKSNKQRGSCDLEQNDKPEKEQNPSFEISKKERNRLLSQIPKKTPLLHRVLKKTAKNQVSNDDGTNSNEQNNLVERQITDDKKKNSGAQSSSGETNSSNKNGTSEGSGSQNHEQSSKSGSSEQETPHLRRSQRNRTIIGGWALLQQKHKEELFAKLYSSSNKTKSRRNTSFEPLEKGATTKSTKRKNDGKENVSISSLHPNKKFRSQSVIQAEVARKKSVMSNKRLV